MTTPAAQPAVQHDSPKPDAAGNSANRPKVPATGAAPGPVQQAANTLLRAVGDALNETAGRAKRAVTETASAKRSNATDAVQQLRDRAQHTASTVGRAAAGAVGDAVDVATGAIGDALEAARQMTPREQAAARTSFTVAEARLVGEEIGIVWATAPFDVEQFRIGMGVELEHGFHDAATNVTYDDPTFTGKIALAHLNEFADYYTRLEHMEATAKQEWGATRTPLLPEARPAAPASER